MLLSPAVQRCRGAFPPTVEGVAQDSPKWPGLERRTSDRATWHPVRAKRRFGMCVYRICFRSDRSRDEYDCRRSRITSATWRHGASTAGPTDNTQPTDYLPLEWPLICAHIHLFSCVTMFTERPYSVHDDPLKMLTRGDKFLALDISCRTDTVTLCLSTGSQFFFP